MDYLFATDAEQKAKELLKEARGDAVKLRDWTNAVIEALDRHESGAFDRGWIDRLQERVVAVASNVDRANGAVLVHGTPR